MNVFIDTSALLAVLDRSDRYHAAAKPRWISLLESEDNPVCHNYILVETSAVVLRRFGLEALKLFERDIVPVFQILWVNREIHEAAVGAQLLADKRSLSLVDCVSFEIMRRSGLRTAFTFDSHFAEFGYKMTPFID